jgi:hypothetical protein
LELAYQEHNSGIQSLQAIEMVCSSSCAPWSYTQVATAGPLPEGGNTEWDASLIVSTGVLPPFCSLTQVSGESIDAALRGVAGDESPNHN